MRAFFILLILSVSLLLARPAVADWKLYQNEPNPFGSTNTPSTLFTVDVAESCAVLLYVTNTGGDSLLAQVGVAFAKPGDTVTFSWDGRGDNGQFLPAGSYPYVVQGWINTNPCLFCATMWLQFSPSSPVAPTTWGGIKALYR